MQTQERHFQNLSVAVARECWTRRSVRSHLGDKKNSLIFPRIRNSSDPNCPNIKLDFVYGSEGFKCCMWRMNSPQALSPSESLQYKYKGIHSCPVIKVISLHVRTRLSQEQEHYVIREASWSQKKSNQFSLGGEGMHGATENGSKISPPPLRELSKATERRSAD
jgi:hypothetical protein